MGIKKKTVVLVLNRGLKKGHLRVCFVTKTCKDNFAEIMDLDGEIQEVPKDDLLFLHQSIDNEAKTAKEAIYSCSLKLIATLGDLYVTKR